MTTDTSWISAHLFYHDDPSELLVKCITPLVKELFCEKLISRFFFIRYWLGGPHIRFRVLPASDRDKFRGSIKKCIEAHAQIFFRTSPSTGVIDTSSYDEFSRYHSYAEYGADVRIPLYANNSLHYIPYEPEYDHYGGVKAMKRVQAHFMDSSNIVLDLLAQKPGSNQCMVQGTAATLAATLLEYTDLDQLQSVFEEHFRFWSRFPPAYQKQALLLFQSQYRKQREDIARLVAMTLQLPRLPEARLRSAKSPIERWYFSVQQLYQALSSLDQQGILQLPYLHDNNSAALSILFRCIHMHNNRMGVATTKESYQIYLLLRYLSELVHKDYLPQVDTKKIAIQQEEA